MFSIYFNTYGDKTTIRKSAIRLKYSKKVNIFLGAFTREIEVNKIKIIRGFNNTFLTFCPDKLL